MLLQPVVLPISCCLRFNARGLLFSNQVAVFLYPDLRFVSSVFRVLRGKKRKTANNLVLPENSLPLHSLLIKHREIR